LSIALDRYSGGAPAGGSYAVDNKVVGKPTQVASLPLHAIDFAEIDAERVGADREESARRCRSRCGNPFPQ
jgi:hypothetical protein